MATAVQKITLSASRDIPFNKLVLSQSNVRRVKAGVSIEELAEDIARRTLLQGLSVRPVLDAEGAETGMFEVPAGGRRYRALELLVKQKRLAKTAPVPCVVRDPGGHRRGGFAGRERPARRRCIRSISSAPSRPCARRASEEEIAAAFFVGVNVVKQRLRLAAVSEKLLDVYAEDGMTLEQLMAFTVTNRPRPPGAGLGGAPARLQQEPYQIRRMLTEGAVRASDRRALFVGLDAYERPAAWSCATSSSRTMAAGWRTRPARRLVAEKLKAEAETIAAEGWKWIEVAIDFPYGHTAGLRELTATPSTSPRGGAGDDRRA
jgi:ParB family chromosome partitioning protein